MELCDHFIVNRCAPWFTGGRHTNDAILPRYFLIDSLNNG